MNCIWRTDCVRLGHQGENEARTIAVYVGEWQEAWPGCSIRVTLMRAPGETPYEPAGQSVSGNRLEWLVRAEDTAVPGYGQAELRATLDGVIVKSDVVKTFVEACLPGTTAPEPPDPVKSWFDRLEEDVAGVLDQVTAAETAAQNAQAAADEAQDAAAAAAAAVDGAVRYDAAQELNTQEQAQARANIGAAGAGDVPSGTVRYDAAQSLTDAQKAQARANVGAVDLATLTDGHTPEIEWQQGTVNATTGRNASSGTRIRTDFVQVTAPYCRVLVELAAGYQFTARLYSGQSTDDYTGAAPANWTGGSCVLNVPAGRYIRLVVRRTDDSAITPEEGANVTLTLLTAAASVEDLSHDYTEGGTDPEIIARQNGRYVCGTVSTLSFTPCAVGSCEVVFTSGTSATVLTVPATVRWPDWFDPTSLETGRTYDMIITDGTLGVVTSWAT